LFFPQVIALCRFFEPDDGSADARAITDYFGFIISSPRRNSRRAE